MMDPSGLWLGKNFFAVCDNCHEKMFDLEQNCSICIQSDPPKLFCGTCTWVNREKYEYYHNHYQRKLLCNYEYSVVMVPHLGLLMQHRNPSDPLKLMTIFKTIKSRLNWMYDEGERAHKDEDYREKQIGERPDEFNLCCDVCMVEIEFILFTCITCRSYHICEACYNEERERAKE